MSSFQSWNLALEGVNGVGWMLGSETTQGGVRVGSRKVVECLAFHLLV